VILVVVDRFSKACHLIPTSKIPTTSQTAELLMQHPFRIHGFPQDMMSDQGSKCTPPPFFFKRACCLGYLYFIWSIGEVALITVEEVRIKIIQQKQGCCNEAGYKVGSMCSFIKELSNRQGSENSKAGFSESRHKEWSDNRQ